MTNKFENTNKYNILVCCFIFLIFLFVIIKYKNNIVNHEKFDEFAHYPQQINIDNNLKTYVINLKNRPEKLKYMETQLKKHNLQYEIFEAINGNQLNVKQLEDLNIINETRAKQYMHRSLRRGEYGCALSHIMIWLKLLKTNSDIKYFLILEDDAYLVNNFKQKLKKTLEDLNDKNWDVLYLNENCYKHFGLSCNGDDFSEMTIIPNRVGYGLYGYVINKNFIQKCIKSLFPIYYAVDVFIDEGSFHKKFICIRSKELLVHYNKKFSSDTQLIL